MKALNHNNLMKTDERNKVVEVLEARKIRFHFTKCSFLLFLKGHCDTKKGKVGEEVKRYYATYRKFVEEEYKNLVKEIAPTLIAIQTAKGRIEKAKADAESTLNAKQFHDTRKQRRADRELQAKKQSLQADYQAELKQYDEELAYLEVTLHIVVRLCLSAYEYMMERLELYLKYVELSTEEEALLDETWTYDGIYSAFIAAIRGGDSDEKTEE